jgi:hypothetical protein
VSRLELAALSLAPGGSVWYARLGHPSAFAHGSDTSHYAASPIKLAVLRAAHRDLDLGAQALVNDEFPSVVSGQYPTLRPSWTRYRRARPRCRSKSHLTAIKGTP